MYVDIPGLSRSECRAGKSYALNPPFIQSANAEHNNRQSSVIHARTVQPFFGQIPLEEAKQRAEIAAGG